MKPVCLAWLISLLLVVPACSGAAEPGTSAGGKGGTMAGGAGGRGPGGKGGTPGALDAGPSQDDGGGGAGGSSGSDSPFTCIDRSECKGSISLVLTSGNSYIGRYTLDINETCASITAGSPEIQLDFSTRYTTTNCGGTKDPFLTAILVIPGSVNAPGNFSNVIPTTLALSNAMFGENGAYEPAGGTMFRMDEIDRKPGGKVRGQLTMQAQHTGTKAKAMATVEFDFTIKGL